MKLKSILKVAGIAAAGYAYGVLRTAYRTAREPGYKKTTTEFADSWDELRSFFKPKSTSVEETADDIAEMVSDADEEIAEAVEEAASEVVPDIEWTTPAEEAEDQPED